MKLVKVKKVQFFAGMDKNLYDRAVEAVVNAVRNGERCVWSGREGYFRYHHSAKCPGYVSRKHPEGQLEDMYYKGRFGEGVTIKTPSYDSTRNCYREYYIFEEA